MHNHLPLIVAFAAAIFAGCSAHDGAAVSHPATPPPLQVGQLGVHFSPDALSPGKNSFQFALVRIDRNSQTVIHDDPELQTEVRFYGGRSPNGPPDAHALAQFVKEGTSIMAANGQTHRANFLAELVLPNVSGGALEFIVHESSAREVVIRAPVRIAKPR